MGIEEQSVEVAYVREFIMKNSNGIIATDENNQIRYVNCFAEKFLKLAKDSVIGKDIFSVIPSFGQTSFDSGKVFCIIQNNSHYHVVPLKLKDETGDWLNFYTFVEIEELVWLESGLKNQQKIIDELNEILEGSYDGILVTDKDGKILLVNSSYERVAAIKREDMEGKSMRDLMNPVWMPNSVAYVVAEQKQAVSKKQVTKDGRNIIVTGMPIFDKSGGVKKIVINARDISEIYELREELLKEKKINRTYLENYKEFIENKRDDD